MTATDTATSTVAGPTRTITTTVTVPVKTMASYTAAVAQTPAPVSPDQIATFHNFSMLPTVFHATEGVLKPSAALRMIWYIFIAG
ncbi:uncharacterized protein DFL_000689 [Arthrobotrys flagrans]|uniref:Uncharacterized protein n=1 Tax=Arthrobotrys flagrans TaxID=97331 RepID=A0A437AEL1_ARTFL|nr:hypothetical protein DFL_000689 [Arthrobotrys flagrans]